MPFVPCFAIVLVLDDLQWADTTSLDLFKTLVQDRTIPNLLLIGCYRSNEDDDDDNNNNNNNTNNDHHHDQIVLDDETTFPENAGASNTTSTTTTVSSSVAAPSSMARTTATALVMTNTRTTTTTITTLAQMIRDLKKAATTITTLTTMGETTTVVQDSPKNSGCDNVRNGKDSYHVTEITLGNLSLESVHEMIQELLSVSVEKAKGLSNICFKRTLGNVFFVKEFLLLLQEMNILVFNIGTFQWTWNDAIVEKETGATLNVVSMIRMKINKYSDDGMVLLLSLAACLGNTFDYTTMKLLWGYLQDKYYNKRSRSSNDDDDDGVDELLQMAMREMLIEPIGGYDDETTTMSSSLSYRFVHDKIQETAMLLMPENEFEEFRTDIGKYLYEHLPDEELQNMLFVIADLLNNGLYEGVEMAELNGLAAQKAQELSAFHSAVHYVEKGILNLHGTNMWEEYADLCLLLHSIGAEAEECAGNNIKSDWYCKEVQRQNNISIVGKMRVINIVVERLYSNGKYEDLWFLCLDTLDQLGCRLARNRKLQYMHASLSMQKTKRYFLPQAAEQVQSMSMVVDATKREAISFMIKAASFCLGSKNKPLYILLCCQCLQWTQKFGLTAYTASGFASFANVLMHEYCDWRMAMKVAEIALTIENRLGSNYTKTSTLHKINSFVLGWVKPLRTCRTKYLEAYKVGMLSGNIGGVGMAILFFLMCEFFSGGHKLQGLEEDLRNYIPQLEKLKLHTFVLGLRLLWQKVLNLMGAPYNPHTIVLTGTAMYGIDIERHPFIYNTVGRHHICNLCAYFSEYEKGANIALSMGDEFYKTWSGASYFGFEPFSRALCLYAMAIDTGQTKYVKAARKARSCISNWVKSGAINLVHELFILDAEDAVLVKHNSKQMAKTAYNLAIMASVRGGFLQDAGIANERYAYYLLTSGLLSDATFYMKEAIQYFTEWGATRKVQLLRDKYGVVLDLQ